MQYWDLKYAKGWQNPIAYDLGSTLPLVGYFASGALSRHFMELISFYFSCGLKWLKNKWLSLIRFFAHR